MAKAKKSLTKLSDHLVSVIGSKEALSWWVPAGFLTAAIEASIVFDRSRLGGPFSVWVIVAAVGYLAMLILFGIGRLVIKPTETKLFAVQVLILYTTIAFVRAIVLHFTALAFGYSSPQDLTYRIVTAPLYVNSVMMVFAVAVSNVKRYQASVAELSAERVKLQLASVNLKGQIERIRTELVARVNGILEPAILDLQGKLNSINDAASSMKAVNGLKETVEQVIRPLSHDVAQPNFENLMLVPDVVLPAGKKTSSYRTRVTTSPIWAAFVVMSVGLGPALILKGFPDGIVLAFLMGISFWSTLTLTEQYFGRRKLTNWQAGIVTISSFAVSALVLFLLAVLFGYKITAIEETQFVILSAILGSLFFLTDLTRNYRDENLQRLKATNHRFELLNSKLRRQVWLDHRRMATALHGQVQASLYAAAMRLSQEAKPSAKLIEQIRGEVASILNNLQNSKGSTETFDQVLEQMIEIWGDTADFELALEPEACSALDASPDATECAIEVVREALNNAVKHGEAKTIVLSVEKISEQLISVRVINDGQPLKEGSKAGFGSEVLDDFTHRWSLKPLGDRVQFEAQILV